MMNRQFFIITFLRFQSKYVDYQSQKPIIVVRQYLFVLMMTFLSNLSSSQDRFYLQDRKINHGLFWATRTYGLLVKTDFIFSSSH